MRNQTMLSFISIAIAVALFVKISKLEERIRELERKGSSGTPTPAQIVEAVVSSAPQTFAYPDGSGSDAPARTPLPRSDGPSPFVLWLKEDTLLKIGAFLLLIGFGWLLTYAFMENWIGPSGRIAIGLVAGSLFMVFGWWRMLAYPRQGSVFLVLGSSVVILTVFVSRVLGRDDLAYDLFSPTVALGVMFLATAFVMFASLRFRIRALAVTSLAIAGLVPLLVRSPAPDFIGLDWYFLIVVLGSLSIIWKTGWRVLALESLIIVALYNSANLVGFPYADRGVLLLFAYAFAGIFFVANVLMLMRDASSNERGADIATGVLNAAHLVAWISFAASTEWRSIIIVAWALVFFIGAYLLLARGARRDASMVYTAIGAAFIAIATAIELEGPSLVVAYALEAALASALPTLLFRGTRIGRKLLLLMAIPIGLSAESFGAYAWRLGVFHSDFVVLLVIAVVTALLAEFHRRWMDRDGERIDAWIVTGFSVSAFYASSLAWLSFHAGQADQDTATLLSLVLYTITGLACMIHGRQSGSRAWRTAGIVYLTFVIGRLFLIEVWHMGVPGRIVTFFSIGALLMATAFLRKKK